MRNVYVWITIWALILLGFFTFLMLHASTKVECEETAISNRMFEDLPNCEKLK